MPDTGTHRTCILKANHAPSPCAELPGRVGVVQSLVMMGGPASGVVVLPVQGVTLHHVDICGGLADPVASLLSLAKGSRLPLLCMREGLYPRLR